jgi:hypothetical protein
MAAPMAKTMAAIRVEPGRRANWKTLASMCSRPSPQNPPRPFSSGQAAGGRGADSRPASARRPTTPTPARRRRSPRWAAGIGLRDASHAEDQHQQGRAPAGQAHRLDHDVGDRRAGAAQGVGGLDVGRGVQAGIGGVIGGDGQQQAAPTTVIRPPRNRADQG